MENDEFDEEINEKKCARTISFQQHLCYIRVKM